MKILVMFTGGTIGSKSNGEYISVNSNNNYRIIEEYHKAAGRCGPDDKSIIFDTTEVYTLLSENLDGEHLRILGKSVRAVLEGNHETGYDGIIITHGSDTIQYSAAMLDLLFPTAKIPIMLVASNHVLDDEAANGIANFCAAVDAILEKKITGVHVPYLNSDGKMYIHKGACLLPHLPYSDDLFSTPFCIDTKDVTLHLPTSSESDILVIHPYPGMSYPVFTEKNVPKYILLNTYHSGTLVCNSSDARRFFRDAHTLGIPVFLTGAETGISYESTSVFDELYIEVLPPASPIAAYMLLWLT